MSRQRTIWEKTSTLCPPASSLGSSLSISTSLPAAWIMACSWKSGASGLWHFLKLSNIFSSAPETDKSTKVRSHEISRWFEIAVPGHGSEDLYVGSLLVVTCNGLITMTPVVLTVRSGCTVVDRSFSAVETAAGIKHWNEDAVDFTDFPEF